MKEEQKSTTIGESEVKEAMNAFFENAFRTWTIQSSTDYKFAIEDQERDPKYKIIEDDKWQKAMAEFFEKQVL